MRLGAIQGGGLAYGTKDGRLRLLQPQKPVESPSSAADRAIAGEDETAGSDTSPSVLPQHHLARCAFL